MRDEVECRYHGRDFTTAEMALMRSLIAASPQQTRAGLAREFCHAINWVGPDDRIRAMMARLTMLAMHRDGIITLPPPRQAPRRLRKPEPCRETDPPQAPVPETLEAVRPIRLVCITGADRKASRVWNGFVARWHYLGYTPLIGAQMRYAAEDREGRTLALLGFSAAAWKTAPRDAFIGWSPQVREKNLQYVIDNSRYLILPWVRIPNLASHILSEARRQLPQDWYDRYKVAPVLMETFVEIPRFTGAVYKASGWIRVGTTPDAASTTAKTNARSPKRIFGSAHSARTGSERSTVETPMACHHCMQQARMSIPATKLKERFGDSSPRATPKCTSENDSVMSVLPCGRARRWRESCKRRFAYASRLPSPDPR